MERGEVVPARRRGRVLPVEHGERGVGLVGDDHEPADCHRGRRVTQPDERRARLDRLRSGHCGGAGPLAAGSVDTACCEEQDHC